jgi:2-isopropylmalate synthase
MYEHVEPEQVGNKRNVLVSDLSGQSNIRYKAKELGIDIAQNREFSKKFVQNIKSLEYEGFQFDGAEASFELLLCSELEAYKPFFEIIYSKINVMHDKTGRDYAESVLKVKVGDEVEHTACDGDGPVNALDNALRKALTRFYPEIASVHLIDYKVRVLGDQDGTAAKVRVLVESSDGENSWSTVGVSKNIIEASLQALNDSLNYKIYHFKKKGMVKEVS